MAQSSIVGQENDRVKSTATSTSEPPTSSKRGQSKRGKKGVTVQARYTDGGPDPLKDVVWERRQSVITSSGGNWAWQEKDDTIGETANAYERPQCSACFIQAVNDDLMSIYDLVKSEARLFKYGSGTGSNFSTIRGKQEKLSGGGTSSGLMSFLEVLDRAAGATKSGGTTRRAPQMLRLDMDHPALP